MAIWQLDVYLVPKASMPSRGLRLTPDEFGERDWWIGHGVPSDVLEEATDELTPLPQWTPSIRSWGVEDGNRIDIATGESGVDEIRVRLDARNVDEAFLHRIITLAANAECALVTESMEVIPPLVNDLTNAIHDSDAWRFVRDPRGFLEGRGDENLG